MSIPVEPMLDTGHANLQVAYIGLELGYALLQTLDVSVQVERDSKEGPKSPNHVLTHQAELAFHAGLAPDQLRLSLHQGGQKLEHAVILGEPVPPAVSGRPFSTGSHTRIV
jgi:hypothetical protein